MHTCVLSIKECIYEHVANTVTVVLHTTANIWIYKIKKSNTSIYLFTFSELSWSIYPKWLTVIVQYWITDYTELLPNSSNLALVRFEPASFELLVQYPNH